MSRLINFFRGTPDSKPKPSADALTSARMVNTINELQILQGHTDIVRLLIRVDELRIASASDDGKIIIWSYLTGERLGVLEGHTRPITCLLMKDRNTLVSGSSDKSIKLWNVATLTCINTLTFHEGSLRCLVNLQEGLFCSGANDRFLCVWKGNGELVGTIERHEEENLHCLLPIRGHRLITGSNSSLILVYNTDTLAFHKILAYHRESVRCLVSISDHLFASASLDGAIVVWQAETLTPLKILHYPNTYRDEDHVYVYNVNHMQSMSERYLAVAIGHGFRIYDVLSGDCIVQRDKAHDAPVEQLLPLYEGSRFVTCSEDASIRLWGFSPAVKFLKSNTAGGDSHHHYHHHHHHHHHHASASGKPKSSPRRSHKRILVEAVLLGEMWAHSDAVHCLLGCTESSFASCGADHLVVLWKDGVVQSELRNGFAAASLNQHKALFEMSVAENEAIVGDTAEEDAGVYPEELAEALKSDGEDSTAELSSDSLSSERDRSTSSMASVHSTHSSPHVSRRISMDKKELGEVLTEGRRRSRSVDTADFQAVPSPVPIPRQVVVDSLLEKEAKLAAAEPAKPTG